MADLHRHGYTIADLVLSDGACERLIESLQPTVSAMVRDSRFMAAVGEPGLVAVRANVFEPQLDSWRQSAEVYTVRVHLERHGGSTRVIPMSHRQGTLSDAEIRSLTTTGPIAELSLPQGALLVMAPRLVHTAPSQRVLEIELGPARGS